ncbi:UDP-3-O-acylglucosamine N-acyltransferase [Bacteroidia bacterium]|nr:UDP-3-O-acylglucosamine N-acyltransferase [Bacteroidia bacterium]
MQLYAKDIAEHLHGTLEGEADTPVTGFARIEQAQAGDLCFLANTKYEEWLYKTKASLAIVSRSFVLKQPVSLAIVWVDNAYQGIAAMLDLYAALNAVQRKGRKLPSHVAWTAKVGKACYIGQYAYIAKGARVGNNVKIFPQVYVGDNVTVGDNTILYPGVRVYAGCSIGKNCTIHAGTVIGADGFGFAPDENKVYKKIPQLGNVIIEDDVEIGANTCIDRATMNSTIIRKGVKLDNLIQVGHNVEIGANTVMASGTGIAGSTKIGERCMFGGKIGIAPHIKIGDDVMVGAGSGVSNDVPNKSMLMGYPAFGHRDFMRSHVVFKNLYELQNTVYALKKEMEELQKKV